MLMTKANIKFLMLGLSMVTMLSACSLPKPQSRDQQDNNASFFIDSAPGDVRPDSQVNSLGLPEAKTFSFSACLKDTAKLKPITNQNFKVQELDQSFKTDMNGCLTWSEKVEFNYLADSQYVQLDRHLLGTGLHTGVRTVSYAINPWAHGESIPQVIDLTKASVSSLVKAESADNALKGLGQDKNPRRRSLWANAGTLNITQQKFTQNGVDLLVEFRATPSIQLTKMNGDIVYVNLNRGQYKARLTLINTYFQDGQEKRKMLGQSGSIDAAFTAGILTLSAPVSVQTLPTSGTIAFGLELSAVNPPAGLTPFQGVYQVGEYDKLKGGGSLQLDTNAGKVATNTTDAKIDVKADDAGQVNLQTYINDDSKPNVGAKSDVKTDTGSGPAPVRAKFEIGELSFSFVKVLRESSSSKEILFSIKACPKSALDQKIAREQKFKITHFRSAEKMDSSIEEFTSDNNGCVTWNENLAFNYFECQRYFSGKVRMQNADLGMDESIEVLVNPWEKATMLAKDGRYLADRSVLALSCDKEKKLGTKLWLKTWSYNSLSYDYKIDSTLDLTLVKKVQLSMDARLISYSSNSDGIDSETKLRAGLYLLKVLVTGNAEYQDGATYITHAKKIVTVTDGQINTDVEFLIHDLKTLANRNNIIFTLIPLDEKKAAALAADADPETAINTASGLDIGPFIGPVLLNMDDQSKPLRPLDGTGMAQYFTNKASNLPTAPVQALNQIMTVGLQKIEADRQAKIAMANKETFARENNLELLNLNQMTKPLYTRVAPADLQAALITGTVSNRFAHSLCVYWATDFLRKLSAEKNVVLSAEATRKIGQDCVSMAGGDTTDVFLTEKRIFIKEFGGARYSRGTQETVTVGTNFAMKSSHSHSKTSSYGWSASAGLSSYFANIIGMGLNANYSMTWSDSDDTGSENSQSVAQSTSLSVQQNIFEVTANKYEQCGIVRINPAVLKDRGGWFSSATNWAAQLDSKLSVQDRMDIATRGIMVCTGVDQDQAFKVNESYYLINQDTFYTHIQDSGDVRNRNFFAALRGAKEYQRFLTTIKAVQSSAQGSGTDTSLRANQVDTTIRLFQLGTSSFPGSMVLRETQAK